MPQLAIMKATESICNGSVDMLLAHKAYATEYTEYNEFLSIKMRTLS